MLYRFDDFEVDTDQFELRHRGETRHVEPLVFDLIAFLCRNPDRVVTRNELVEGAWQGRTISDATISTGIKFARKALGDTGDSQKYIRTVRGRGFRLTADVTVGEVEVRNEVRAEAEGALVAAALPAATPAAVPIAPPAAAMPRTMSAGVILALLPFGVFSEDAQLAFFAEGLAEDLTTILARISGLTVISRSSSFVYQGTRPSAAKVRAELGATHMVVGSVRPLGEIARISVQLVETAGGSQLWAEHFDRPIPKLFELQDDIIRGINRMLEPRLVRESFERIEPRHYETDAWQAYQRATGLVAIKGWHNDTFAEAAELLRRSVAIDPDFARAHGFLALILGLGQRVGLVHDRRAAVAESLAAAERALALDTTDSTVLGFAGCALADIGHRDRGLSILEHAVELDPSNAQAWAALGAAQVLDDRPAEAIVALRRGIAISPLDNRLAVWTSFLAVALLAAGDLEAALTETELACRRDLRNHIPRVVRAAVLVAANRPQDAKRALDEARRLRPGLEEQQVRSLVGNRLAESLLGLGKE